MAAPAVLNYGSPLADSDRVVGPLLVTIGGVAVWEVTRKARLAALPLGIWLLIAPWLFGGPASAISSNVGTGLAVGALSMVHGYPAPAFGGGWEALWSSPSPYADRSRSDRPTRNERAQQAERQAKHE